MTLIHSTWSPVLHIPTWEFLFFAALAWRRATENSIISGDNSCKYDWNTDFCVCYTNMFHETQSWRYILNHTGSPGDSSTVQTEHVTERLSHHVIYNIVRSVFVCAHIPSFICSMSSICQLLRQRGESARWGDRQNESKSSLWKPPTSICAIM